MRGVRLTSAAAAAATAALALPLASPALGPALLLTARTTGAQEVPRQSVHNPRAAGRFTARLVRTPTGYRLVWRLTFSRLTGAATSAYIHLGRRGSHGAAMAMLCSPCRSGASGSQYFSPPELALARQGKLYVNIRTLRNPAGEIRGQIAVA